MVISKNRFASQVVYHLVIWFGMKYSRAERAGHAARRSLCWVSRLVCQAHRSSCAKHSSEPVGVYAHNLMLIHFDKHKYVSSYCIGVMVGTVKLLASDGYLINTELWHTYAWVLRWRIAKHDWMYINCASSVYECILRVYLTNTMHAYTQIWQFAYILNTPQRPISGFGFGNLTT